jgi:glycosyltransferase involved in cell wall biosynthesis
VAPERTSVIVVRGHQVTPWELRPWRELPERFDVRYLASSRNMFSDAETGVRPVPARTTRGLLPRAGVFDHVAGVVGDRYLGIDDPLSRAAIVHAEELAFWFSADVARRKPRHRYKLVQTVWETIPFMDTFRNRHARSYREEVLRETDLFLPATERARDALLMEGVAEERIRVCPPGIDMERFGSVSPPEPPPSRHLLLSVGRLVWEKGHQDVIRALAALHRGAVELPAGVDPPRLMVVGAGPEESRLEQHARELSVADSVEFRRSIPYDEMPEVYGQASCLVLASLASAGCMLHPNDVPRCFWEEQFGLVLAEAMGARLPIVASSSGAIPEVCGDSATYSTPGDWKELAQALADGPLSRAPASRHDHPAEVIDRYSTAAMAERLADAYDAVLAT